MKTRVCLILLLLTLLWLTVSASASAQGEHLVLAFYYAWYSPDSFGQGKTSDQPITAYTSANRGTIVRQVAEAKQAGIDAFIQSWYGPDGGANNQTESNFNTLLDVAQSGGFRAAVDFETGGPFFKNKTDVQNALAALLAGHAQHPAYLKVGGKPVIFFWQNSLYSVNDWIDIRNAVDPLHLSIWIGEGTNLDYLRVFDGHHLYNIAWSTDPRSTNVLWGQRVREKAIELGSFKYWVGTAMPGWNDTLLKRSGSFARDRSDGDYFRSSFLGVTQSSADWAIITSYNEWLEGSQIEPSVSYGSTYLDLAAELGNIYRTTASNYVTAPTETTMPTNTPTATPTPTDTPLPTATLTRTPVKIAQVLPDAAKAASGVDIKPTPSLQPRVVVKESTADPETKTLLALGSVCILGISMAVGWLIADRTRR